MTAKIILSEIVKIKDIIEIVKGEEIIPLEGIVSVNHNENDKDKHVAVDDDTYSNRFTVKLDNVKIVIRGSNKKKSLINSDDLKFTNYVCFSKLNLALPEISVYTDDKGDVMYSVSTPEFYNEFQKDFVVRQLDVVSSLINDSDGFLEYAHLRRAQIYTILYYLSDNAEKEKYSKSIVDEYKILIEKSKRMKNMYENFIKKF